MSLKTPEFTSPMEHISDIVQDALNEFINRESTYIYSEYNKRKLFSLEDKEDYLHNSNLSIDEYIQKHNLEYKWSRLNIQENFTYKQQKQFKNSGLSLDEFIEKKNLYTATITGNDENESNEIDMYINYDDDDDYTDYYSDNFYLDDNDYDYIDNDDDDDDINDGWGN